MKFLDDYKAKVIFFVKNIWERSANRSHLLFKEKVLFVFLCAFECVYKIVFAIVQKVQKKLYKGGYRSQYCVISVGNISSGGTGKSVVVSFLMGQFKDKRGAIVLRGYKAQKLQGNLLVSDGTSLLCDITYVGDEAYMFADKHAAPIVVGKNRRKSFKLLERFTGSKRIDYIVLDDAYQNYQIYKDFQIVLLDARSPFGNNHCLPAGPLREKDCSRADVIILTHADLVAPEKLKSIESYIHRNQGPLSVFYGQHVIKGLFRYGKHFTPLEEFKNKHVGVICGIADNKNFISSMRQIGLVPVISHYYIDHHVYTSEDIDACVNMIEKYNLEAMVTTRKDWYKIVPFLHQAGIKEDLPFYVLDVDFAFLLEAHEQAFFDCIAAKTHMKRKE